jgi:hypothetical protein
MVILAAIVNDVKKDNTKKSTFVSCQKMPHLTSLSGA